MDKIVAMVIIGWVPQQGGTLKESWRIEQQVSMEHCMTMDRFSGGGKFGAITVRCTPETK